MLSCANKELGETLPESMKQELSNLFSEQQTFSKTRIIVRQNALLPNYPNPFNPETWMPFHLAREANVTIRIYDLNGQAVRTLSLGRLKAGSYEDRLKAAYWDGKSDTGEAVSSGIYVYRLQAGHYSAVRRMVLLK